MVEINPFAEVTTLILIKTFIKQWNKNHNEKTKINYQAHVLEF